MNRADRRSPLGLLADTWRSDVTSRVTRVFCSSRGGIASLLALSVAVAGACYTSGDGTKPPNADFNFPVGLAVSPGGRVLYVANSDFDLQYNGGTIQSYNLAKIRVDAIANAKKIALADRNVDGGAGAPFPDCTERPTGPPPLGQGCAPSQLSSAYFVDSVIIGAFSRPRRQILRSCISMSR